MSGGSLSAVEGSAIRAGAAMALMPQEAPRERVMQLVAGELLARLTGDRYWGGPYPRPVTVSRLFRHPYQVSETPHIIVIQDDGSQLGPIGHDSPDPATVYDDRFRVQLIVYVDGDDVDSPSLWLERVNLDCKRILRRAVTGPAGVLVPLVVNLRFLEETVDFHDTRGAGTVPMLAQLRDPLFTMLDGA